MNYLTFALLGLALAACVHQPEMGWVRTDGKPVVPIQFEADETNCRGESDKADLSSTMRRNITLCENGLCSPREEAVKRVFAGCMAGKGYVQRPLP
jgi:hypothetical protein